MAEPASLIGAISASLHLVKEIANYFNSFHDAPKHAADLSEELVAVSHVLGMLRKALEERTANVRFDRTSVLFFAASGCRRRLQAVHDALAPLFAANHVLRLFRRITWPFSREETLEDVQAIHRFAQVFHFATTVEGLSALSLSQHDALEKITAQIESMEPEHVPQSLKTILEAVKEIPELSAQLAALAGGLTRLTIDGQLSRLLDSIPAVEYQDRHRNLQLTRMEGASQWILDMPKFNEWRDGPSTNGALWCNGAPGAGKTYLASVIIDHLIEISCQDTDASAVLYFYFDYKKQSEQTPLKVLQTLLRQLLATYTSVPKEAENMFKGITGGRGLPSWKDMKLVFIDLCNSRSSLFIVFDALDECDASANRGPIVELIKEIKKCRARLLVTSRPYPPDIDKLFGDCSQILVEASDSDIRAYVLDQIARSEEMSAMIDRTLREKIVQSILAKSQGMFLLPALQINNVLGQTDKYEIEKALEALPSGLADNLAMTIERIKSQHAQSQSRASLALSVLQWLSTVKRPITTTELQHAIAIKRHKIDLKDLKKPGFFVDCCFGLVVIDSETSVIRLVHFSVNEFLQEQRGVLFDNPDGDLAASCLSYISACSESQSYSPGPDTFGAIEQKWALLNYAACFWGIHAGIWFDQRVRDKLDAFFSSPTALQLWCRYLVQIYQHQLDDDSEWSAAAKHVTEDVTALHIAAIYDLSQLAADCISNDADTINRRNSVGARPLMLAAASGHKRTLELMLLSPSLDINAQDSNGWTALCYAICYVQLDVVRILLGESPRLDINAGDIFQMACTMYDRSGDPECLLILELLLAHPALDLVAQSAGTQDIEPGWSMLSKYSRLDVLRILMARPDFNIWRYRWPDAREYREQCYNYLWNIDQSVPDYGPEPMLAIPEIALLLDSGFPEVDDFWALKLLWPFVYFVFGPMTTPLGDTYSNEGQPCYGCNGLLILDDGAHSGRKALRKIMESQSISFDTTDSRGRGFLHYCAKEHREGENRQYLPFLLDHGTQVDLKDKSGRTALHFAAESGDEDAVRCLIEAGASPLTADDSGWTILHSASLSNSVAIIKLLVRLGADVNATTKLGNTALHVAAQYSKSAVEIIAFLAANGIAINKRNRYGESATQKAIFGEESSLRTLFELGADPLECNLLGTSTLARAFFNMDAGMTKLCLDHVKEISDLLRPTFCGMSAFDYLSQHNASVADELGFISMDRAAWILTPPTTRRANMVKSIGARLKFMISGGDEDSRSLYYFTAHMLLLVGDDDSARIMLEYGMVPESKHGNPYHEYGCDNCFTQKSPLFKCRTCPYAQFCRGCLKADKAKGTRCAQKCAGHSFLQFPSDQWRNLPDGQVNDEKQSFQDFLKALEVRYPAN